MAKAFIASFHFNPGHVSHMIASYKQCEELGYETYYYIDKAFVPFLPFDARKIVYGERIKDKVSLLILTFPSPQNLTVLRRMKKKYGTKVVYIFHEPLDKLSVLRKSGFSAIQLFKAYIMGMISAITVRRSDVILLPSEKAVSYYDANSLYRNKNRYYIPLLFDDESRSSKETAQRRFFSYIGTVAPDHSFKEYTDFVVRAILDEKMQEMDFLIATKNDFDLTPDLQNCIDRGRLTVIKGAPLTNDEINSHYATSYAIWNAYERSMQSGVLAKSFMFGTPAIVLRRNLNEFTKDGINVLAIDDNTSFEQIESALRSVWGNFNSFSETCRKCFLDTFYYRKYNEQVANIIK